jgi:ATP-dependent DNA helicase RecG
VDAETIERRLRAGEDSRTEFKSAREELPAKTLAKEIAAFANGQGGQLFLGVEDDGSITGAGTLREADQLMQRVTSTCQTSVHPAIWCSILKVEVQSKLLVIVDVPAFSPDRPYRVDRIFYLRDGMVCREATRTELVRMLQSQDAHFDETPVSGAARDDLDFEAVDAFLRDAYHPGAAAQRAHYLSALKCIEPDETPTVAGILLFGRDPQRWLPDARVSAVRFATARPSNDLTDRREITGALTTQIEGVIAFLRQHVPAPSRVEGWDRVERGLPEPVLREAVLNALAHRDYRAASQVRIFVHDDRVEVINAGLLLNHLTLDSIRLGGISQRRNPIVAALLSRARRRENLGIGVPEMIAMMRERGLPEPEFELSGGHFRVVLRWTPAPGGGA